MCSFLIFPYRVEGGNPRQTGIKFCELVVSESAWVFLPLSNTTLIYEIFLFVQVILRGFHLTAGDLKGRYVAGVFAEFYGDQVDWLVQAAVFVRVSLFF